MSFLFALVIIGSSMDTVYFHDKKSCETLRKELKQLPVLYMKCVKLQKDKK